MWRKSAVTARILFLRVESRERRNKRNEALTEFSAHVGGVVFFSHLKSQRAKMKLDKVWGVFLNYDIFISLFLPPSSVHIT